MGNQIPDYDPDLGNNHDHAPIPVDNLSKIFRIGYAYEISLVNDEMTSYFNMVILREIVSDIFPTLLCFEIWDHDRDESTGRILQEYHFVEYMVFPISNIDFLKLKNQNEIRFLKLSTLK